MDKENNKIKQALQMSRVNMPFEDFEQRVMRQISDLEKVKAKALSDRKYAILFFLLGSIFGIMLNNYFINRIQTLTTVVAYRNYALIFSQIIFVLLICFFCLQLWKLIKIQKEKSYQ